MSLHKKTKEKNELQEKMFKKYPIIFQDRTKPMSETCMCWGLCIGNGWYKIIDDLCSKLEWVRKTSRIKIIASQVKEKYASLRFYTREEYPPKMSKEDAKIWWDVINNFIDKAEHEASITCESCGTYISNCINDNGWYYALCKECKKELDETRNKRAVELLKAITKKVDKVTSKHK